MSDIFTLGFSAFPGIGTKRFEKLITIFGSTQRAWEGEESKLINVLGKQIGKRFSEFRETFNVLSYAKELQEKRIHFFTPLDKEYPVLLKQLPHPPFILFAKGTIALLQNNKMIGVVGTRKVTSYGREVTEMITRDLVSQNVTIVSGMALGVDGIAHRTALKNRGKTIAVLGSGVTVPTPVEHTNLYQEILDSNGLVVSTFSPGEGASKGSFPARNAIIAGMSCSVLVTEGAEDSGALITASFAKKFGRLTFSVPGQITSNLSKGTNNLIKNGAIPISSAQEILDKLGIIVQTSIQKDATVFLSDDERGIAAVLKNGPLLFDEIVRKIGKDSKSIGSLLSLMELRGLITTNPEGKYSL